jgi:hypothetical protein
MIINFQQPYMAQVTNFLRGMQYMVAQGVIGVVKDDAVIVDIAVDEVEGFPLLQHLIGMQIVYTTNEGGKMEHNFRFPQ